MFFVQQNGFTNKTKIKTEFESMVVNEMNKCLSKFYVSVTRKDSSFYKKTSLLYHLKSPPHNKNLSFRTTVDSFSEANKRLNSYLKQLISEGNL